MFNLKSDEAIDPSKIYFRALDQVHTCQKKLELLSKKEKKNFIRTEMDKGFKGVTVGGHIILELTLVPGWGSNSLWPGFQKLLRHWSHDI